MSSKYDEVCWEKSEIISNYDDDTKKKNVS